ncbi:MAG: hypothetical protein AAF198_05110 [Pseudomonadota bacterium]
MSNRIEAAQYLYRNRFPDENLTPYRAFEDRNYVLVQFLHGDGDDKETPLGTEIFEFKGDVSIHSLRRLRGKLYHVDMYDRAVPAGPKEAFDLQRTDANKELIRQYFAATAYTEGDFLKLFSWLVPSEEELPKAISPRNVKLAEDMRTYAASFIHDELTINSSFPTDVVHHKEHMMDFAQHVIVTDIDLLIGCGNFVYLQYQAEGRDIGSIETLFVSVEDDQIRYIL